MVIIILVINIEVSIQYITVDKFLIHYKQTAFSILENTYNQA
jgi:hypothetical protein